nr:hypothetical protein [Trametes cingulata]
MTNNLIINKWLSYKYKLENNLFTLNHFKLLNVWLHFYIIFMVELFTNRHVYQYDNSFYPYIFVFCFYYLMPYWIHHLLKLLLKLKLDLVLLKLTLSVQMK